MSNNTVRTRGMAFVEDRIGRSVEDALREMYVDRRMTLAEIGSEWGIGTSTVMEWMVAFGIPRRVIGLQRPRQTRTPEAVEATAVA